METVFNSAETAFDVEATRERARLEADAKIKAIEADDVHGIRGSSGRSQT